MCRAGRSSRPGWKCAARRCELGWSWGRRAVGASRADLGQNENEAADAVPVVVLGAPHRHGDLCSEDWSVAAHAWGDIELREHLDEALVPRGS